MEGTNNIILENWKETIISIPSTGTGTTASGAGTGTAGASSSQSLHIQQLLLNPVIQLDTYLSSIQNGTKTTTTTTTASSSKITTQQQQQQESIQDDILMVTESLFGSNMLQAALALLDNVSPSTTTTATSTPLSPLSSYNHNYIHHGYSHSHRQQQQPFSHNSSNNSITKLSTAHRSLYVVNGSKGEQSYMCILSDTTTSSCANNTNTATTTTAASFPVVEYCSCRSFLEKTLKSNINTNNNNNNTSNSINHGNGNSTIFGSTATTNTTTNNNNNNNNNNSEYGGTMDIHANNNPARRTICKHLLALKLMPFLNITCPEITTNTEIEFANLVLDRTMGYHHHRHQSQSQPPQQHTQSQPQSQHTRPPQQPWQQQY